MSAAKSSPPQSSKLSGKAREDGTYQISYLPKFSGDYTAVVTAPDGRGTAQALFHAVDPAALPPDLVSAGVDFAVGYFCEVFSGPISGHMQAIFLHEGRN